MEYWIKMVDTMVVEVVVETISPIMPESMVEMVVGVL